jgi:hypothetical protein
MLLGGIDLNVDLPTLLDNRALTSDIRKSKQFLRSGGHYRFIEYEAQDFFEFQAPSITAVAEGGLKYLK